MAKGSQFEREICKSLSSWWSKGTNENLFWRTSNSGGRMTTLSKKGNAGKFHHGDICAIDPLGQPLIDFCTIECKKGYPKASIMDLLDRPQKSKEPEYAKWIAQARREAESADAYGWLLIHKRDRREPLVFTPLFILNALDVEADDAVFGNDLACLRWKGFLDIDPDMIRHFQSERNVT